MINLKEFNQLNIDITWRLLHIGIIRNQIKIEDVIKYAIEKLEDGEECIEVCELAGTYANERDEVCELLWKLVEQENTENGIEERKIRVILVYDVLKTRNSNFIDGLMKRTRGGAMTDLIFGELRENEGCNGWCGKQSIVFGGTTYIVDLLIQRGSDSEIAEIQKKAFQNFMENWPMLQTKLVESLIKYYNEKERFSYGPDDEKEFAEWWPEIETKDALLQAITLETIVVPEDFMMSQGRYIYLLFSRIWGGEDYDDNGIGVCFINEEIDEIAYKDIAF